MTQQEIFDTVCRHLTIQGKPAVNSEECKYRYDGLKCAVGCLIEDDEYSLDYEGNGVLTLFSRGSKFRNFSESDAGLLTSLQNGHDCVRQKDYFIRCGKDLNLDVSFAESLDWSKWESHSKFEESEWEAEETICMIEPSDLYLFIK